MMTRTKSYFSASVNGMLLPVLTLAVGFALSTPQASAQPQSRIVGLWLDHTGRGAVDIQPCGNALCGELIWLADPFTKSGKPLWDAYNENPAKRKRPICGLQIISNVQKIAKNLYDNGKIYGPEKGKSFDVELRLIAADRLQVTGYAGLKIFSEVYLWKRLPETHPIRTGGKSCHDAVYEPS